MLPDARRGSSRRSLGFAALAMLALPLRALAGPGEPQRILVVGDSQAQGVAGGLQRLYRGDRLHRVLDRSKISTGLILRPTYDWPSAASRIVAAEHPDVTVVMFGANDRPPIRIGGRTDPNLIRNFRDSYGDSVRTIASTLAQTQSMVLWVGHPIVRDAVFAEDIELLNELYQQYAVPEGIEWIPTWNRFSTPEGAFTTFGRGADGEMTRLRADDGVHLTPAGYDVIARLLQPMIDQQRSF